MGGGTIKVITVVLTTTGVAGSATDSEVTESVFGWLLDAYRFARERFALTSTDPRDDAILGTVTIRYGMHRAGA